MRQMTFDPSIPMALWVALALVAAALLAGYAWASRGRLSGRRRRAVLGLMAIAVLIPLVVLLNPTWLERIPPPAGKPLVTILVDQSASMATPDAAEGQTRYQAACRLAARAASELADKYEVRLRSFAETSSLVTPDELSRRRPDGAITDLAHAIEDSLDDTRPQGQAMLLLSDGIHNAGGVDLVRQSAAKAKAMAAPLYATTIGGATEVRDLSVSLDRPRELAFVSQRVPVAVKVRQRGSLASRTKLVVTLNDEVVETREVELEPDGKTEEIVEVVQDKTGLFRYEIRADTLPEEVTPLNNSATLLLRVVDEPARVLLLEGKPYWDTKFLIRTLSADPSIDLVTVVRMAEGRLLERRISRVPAGDEAPPGGEEARSDESHAAGQAARKPPAPENRPLRTDSWAIRKDAAEFLSDPASLASCQVVILGRDADVFLSDEALAALEKWLERRECALVCFRGSPSSQIGERLGRLMPVRWTPSRESRFRVRMTESGRDLRWLPRADDAASLAGLPSLATTAESQPKMLAETLAESASGTGGRGTPVVTYAPVGMGRVVVVEGAGMWRWAFLPPEHADRDETYGLLWRSLIRWLVANVELLPTQRLALKLDKTTFTTSESAIAHLLIQEEHLGEGAPEIVLTGAALAEPRTITPVPAGNYPGRFRVVFGTLPEGEYRARVAGAGEDEVGAVAAFDVRRGDLSEVLEVAARPDRMEYIAEQTGGSVLAEADPRLLAQRFDQHLVSSRPERMAQTTAWDRWWVLLGAFALWGTAWGLRRWSGLV